MKTIQNTHNIIKWIATGLIVLATIIRALDASHTMDVILGAIGAVLWTYEGIVMKEPALYYVNGICLVAGLYGMKVIFIG